MSLLIRTADPADAVTIHGFVKALADHQNYASTFKSTAADISRELFGPKCYTYCDIAELAGTPVGVALWHYVFSTFTGRGGLYIDDLFVNASARNQGVGRALLAELARRCVSENLGRLEWAVRTDIGGAEAFYRNLGARPIDEWKVFRLDATALSELGGMAPS